MCLEELEANVECRSDLENQILAMSTSLDLIMTLNGWKLTLIQQCFNLFIHIGLFTSFPRASPKSYIDAHTPITSAITSDAVFYNQSS